MQLQINSANINTFFVKVTFDIFQRKVIFDTSGSSYNNISAVKGISFSLIDQSGLELANGGLNFTTPQIQQPVSSSNWIWTLDLSSVNFAFLFQTYKITAAIQDGDGTIYTIPPVFKTLCQPNDLTDSGYVPGLFQILPDTINSVLTVKELTQLVYNALTPTSVSKSGTLSYPTGTIASMNFMNTPFSNNVVYTGEYRIVCTTVGVYNLQDDCYVNVTYYTNNVFQVTVSNKMSDLFCCIQKLQQTAIKHCNDAIGENARQQLQVISPYLIMGLIAETSGQDASFESDYIKKYLSCNCGNTSISQSEFTPINPSVTSIVLQGAGGTSVPSPTVTGNTQTYNITSSIYQVVKGNTGDLAFTIATDTNTSNTVKYVITINYDLFAGSILNAIGADPALITQLNNLVASAGFSPVGLDGKCVINLATTNYSLSQAINGSTLITNIVINGTNYAAPANLFASNQAAVLGWLSSLTLGAFSVTVASNIISILSINNTNVLSTLTFTTPNTTVQFQAANATLNQVLQAIINYLCGITAAQVALTGALSLCTFDYNGNIISTNYSTSQDNLNAGIAASICNLANRINTLTSVTCAKLQAIFQDSPAAVFNISTDRILAILGGNCVTMTGAQVMMALINVINSNATVKAAFCGIDCTVPGSCPDISNTSVAAINTTSIGVYALTWNIAPSASQTVSVLYRVTGTLPFTTATNSLVVLPSGALAGSSPYAITGLMPNKSYDIFIVNSCGGLGFVKQASTPSSSVIAGSYLLDNATYTICGRGPVTLYSSVPFATGVTMYSDAGLSMVVTGFTYIASVATGFIYTISSLTGVVGASTGLQCNAGLPGTYTLGTNPSTICSNGPATYYTNGAFATGKILYNDAALSSPVTGSTYVIWLASGNAIYNLNSTTGQIGSPTGTSCSSNTVKLLSDMGGCNVTAVTGITGFTPSPALPLTPGGVSQGTHGSFTGAISVTITGSPVTLPAKATLSVNGVVVQCISVTSAGTYTFSSQSYLSTDLIEIDFNLSGC